MERLRILRRRPRPTFALLISVLALAGLAAGCGGGSAAKASTTSPTSAPSSSTTTGSAAANRAKFTSCLESHGVPASAASSFGSFGGFRRGTGSSGAAGSTPSSVTPGSRPSLPSQYTSAFTACRSLLPTGRGGFGALNSPADAAYRNCLQVHGVTLPTRPATGSASSGSTVPRSTPGGGFANNPTFRAAQQACASLLPAGQSGGSGSSPATTAAS